MKRIFGLITMLAALALGTNAVAASFGAGNIVIVRVGNGSQLLTNTGNSVFLDEYTTNAIWAAVDSGILNPVQTIMMPTNWFGAHAPLIMSGAATGQGALGRSVDGRYLALAGYGATLGQFTNKALSSTTTTGEFNQVARVVGLVDGNGHIYTRITQTDANADGNEPRSAVTLDGTNVWLTGEGAVTGGRYLLGGRTSMTSTQVQALNKFNSRSFGIYSNTLYYAANHVMGNPTNTSVSVNPFGGRLPTSFVESNYLFLAGVYSCTITSSPSLGSPFGFVMFNLANQNAGGSLPDTLYVADSVTNAPGEPLGKAGGVLKYCYIPASNAWVNFGYIYADQSFSVTGGQNGTNVTLYITAGGGATPNQLNVLYPYIDVSGYAGSPQTNPDGGDANQYNIFLNPGGDTTRQNTRGIAFAPQGGDAGTISAGAGVISVGPPYGPYFSGPQGGPFNPIPSNFVFSVANLGGTTTNFFAAVAGAPGNVYFTANPSSGTLAPGASTTVTISPNANANSKIGGSTYVNQMIFHLGNIAGPAVASPKIYLNVLSLNLLPDTNYTAVGEPGGPFTPSSYVYAITNQTPNALDWTVGFQNTSTWASLSATTGSVAGFTTTNITVSINSSANSLPLGVYADTLQLRDITAGGPITDHRSVNLQVGFGFFDDFSTFSDSDLVGQNNWFNPTPEFPDEPYQIVGGVLVIPGSAANCGNTTLEEPAKAISANVVTDTTQYVYLGMSMTVTSAYPNPATWDFAFLPFTTPAGGDVTHNQARSSVADAGGGKYRWYTHVNGFDAHVAGTSTYNFGDVYNVYVVGAVDNSNCWVLVEPPSNASPPFDSSYIAAHDGPLVAGWAGPSDPSIGAVDIDHYCSANTQAGFLITKIAMSTNYTAVYNFLTQTNAPPLGDPFATWQTNYFTLGELADPAFSGPNADPLGKGISNTNQFLAGFNPTNSAAYPHIISIARTDGTNATVMYLGASGDNTYMGGPTSRTNVLESTTGAANGSYSNNFVSTGITNILSGGTGLGQVATMVHTNGGTGSTRYYRVRVLVP
jgi:hypothetical protein